MLSRQAQEDQCHSDFEASLRYMRKCDSHITFLYYNLNFFIWQTGMVKFILSLKCKHSPLGKSQDKHIKIKLKLLLRKTNIPGCVI